MPRRLLKLLSVFKGDFENSELYSTLQMKAATSLSMIITRYDSKTQLWLIISSNPLCAIHDAHLDDHVSFNTWLSRQIFPAVGCHFFLW